MTNRRLGPNIKLLRSRRGRSQEEAAAALNIRRSSYSGYENSTAEPPFEVLIRMSEYYKISIDLLLKHDLTILRASQVGILERSFTTVAITEAI